MNNKLDWNKILRYLSGDCTPDEEIEITEWMSSSPENEEFMLFLETIWQMEPTDQKKIDENAAWERFNHRFQFDEAEGEPGFEKKSEQHVSTFGKPIKIKSLNWFRIAGVAASLMIALLISFQFFSNPASIDEISASDVIEYREIQAERGERSRITLSDGSIIHLNGESRLKIPNTFSREEANKVYLEGEAFFEIIRDESVTFQVIANETVTTVLGTRFNVRNYREDDEVTVVVADGRVSIGYLNGSSTEPAVLTKNQKGVIGNGASPRITEVNDLSIYHGWIDGKLIFEQEPLPQMITKLERWFGIDIELIDVNEEIADKQLTATFSERQPVEDIMQSISLALDLTIDRSDTSENRYKLINQ
jgi:transmembrane sensor